MTKQNMAAKILSATSFLIEAIDRFVKVIYECGFLLSMMAWVEAIGEY